MPSSLTDERQATAARFLGPAAAWLTRQGIAGIERVMTDNGSCYRSRIVAQAVNALKARHLFTRPYTTRTNGKVERMIQTLLREWAYAEAYRGSLRRSLALRPYLAYYNTERAHIALGFRSPRATPRRREQPLHQQLLGRARGRSATGCIAPPSRTSGSTIVSGIAWSDVASARSLLARKPKKPGMIATPVMIERSLAVFRDATKPPAGATAAS